MKWEYTKLPKHELLHQETMDICGYEGWELVLVCQEWAIFKRPVEIDLATGFTPKDKENAKRLATSMEIAAHRIAKYG